ncbi:MAG: M15 family metallopeptidase [Brevinema sp.]
MNIFVFFLLLVTPIVAQTPNNQEIFNEIQDSKEDLNTEIYSNIEGDVIFRDFSSENIIRALIRSYPQIVKVVPESENPYYPELAINVRGTNFYNVRGRFLPEQERQNWEKYSSNSLYIYTKVIPNPALRSLEEINLMKKQGSKSYRSQKKPSYYGFNEALYGMSKLADTNKQIMKTRFLGKQVLIHQFAYAALKQVEKEIYSLTNNGIYGGEIRQFLKEGDTVYSFYWRNIAGSKSRSLHSYGVAVDVLEENTKKSVYWLWRQNQKIDWIREPISVRWNPPHSVVQIFEKYGFVWGGKWNFYDTMHFEYKPELLLVNGYNVVFLSQEQITP